MRFIAFSIVALAAGIFGAAQERHTDAAYLHWSNYGGSPDSAQYSGLRQINRSNVKDLKVAWTYPVQDHNHYYFSPIVVHDVMYVMAKSNSLVALDAASGKELWTHTTTVGSHLITNRGINYWESPDRSDRRLLYAQDNFLRELDARTGKSISSFGRQGLVDLRQNLGRDVSGIVLVQSTTPGRVFKNFIILGSATNQEYESAPGDIRAYDIISGKLAWSFHTIPHPGEYGYETWPKDAWKTIGGANVWGEMSLDEKRGILFAPTGSAKYNFYGANRKGANLFGDCVIAIDANTGKRIWHFQMVHHDIWDYDDATGPKLLTVQHNGKAVDAVALATKQGFLYAFNRVTGEPLWPIEERPVPKSDMPGEEAWPTQPFPTNPPPFARQKFSADDLSPFLSPEERARTKDRIESARNEGLFTPPGTRETVQMPGNNGGANWGSSAADPTSGMMYVGSKDLPAMLKLEPELDLQSPVSGSPQEQGMVIYRAKCQLCHHADLRGQPPTVPSLVHLNSHLNEQQVDSMVKQGKGLMPGFPQLKVEDLNHLTAFLFSATPAADLEAAPTKAPARVKGVDRYRSGFGFMFSSSGLSPIAPPWATLTAYDLNAGTIKWQVPIGDVPELAAKGIRNTGIHYPRYGPVVTAGGLIFTGTRDQKVRALDQETGKVVWETEVPAGMEGIPAVYESRGKEYIVFCAAAQSALGAPAEISNGSYVAFALPN